MNITGQFTPGDSVLISDLKGCLGYPVLGRVRSLEQDSDGIPRYFIIEYKKSRLDVKNKKMSQIEHTSNVCPMSNGQGYLFFLGGGNVVFFFWALSSSFLGKVV